MAPSQNRLLAPLAPVQEAPLRAAIAGLRPGGSTNLSGGWLRGLEQLRPGGGGKVLLLTDGVANAGITDPGALAELARSAAREGVGTTTIGFGADFDEQLLTALADAGGGATATTARQGSAGSKGVIDRIMETDTGRKAGYKLARYKAFRPLVKRASKRKED